MKKILFIFFLVGFVCNSYSQSIFSKDHKRFSIDLYTGLNSFHGDIKGKVGFVLGTKLNWHILSAFSLYSALDYARLNGFDQDRNNKFTNNSFKLLFGGEVYLFNILKIKGFSSRFQPYLGLAFGGIKANITQSNINGIDSDFLNKDWFFCYQYLGGLKVRLSNRFDIQGKIAFFRTKTDILDNFKPDAPANKHNDAFNEYTVGLTYYFGSKNKIPIIWNSSKNTALGFNNSKLNKQKRARKEASFINETTKSKVVSDKPIMIDTNEAIYLDVLENEFDCIIKY